MIGWRGSRAGIAAHRPGGRGLSGASAYHGRVDIGLLLIVVLIAVFAWRGPKTLPELGRMLGEGVRAIRRETNRGGGHAGDAAGSAPGAIGR